MSSSKRPKKRPRWLRYVRAFAKVFAAFVTFLTGALVFVSFFPATWSFWKSAAFEQWFGSLLFLVLAEGGTILLYIILRYGVPHYFASPELTISIHQAAKRLRTHIDTCLRDALPSRKLRGGFSWKTRDVWQRLAASVVDAYAEEWTNLRDRGIRDRRLLPSNFQIYARCVTSLLQGIENLNTTATVWTLLRRPLPDWYNLFPLAPNNQSESRGMFTTAWWEQYKDSVRRLKDKTASKIKFKRLVALPNDKALTGDQYERIPQVERSPIEDLKSFCLSNEFGNAASIEQAKRIVFPAFVEIPDEINAVLQAATESVPQHALIHLMGRFSGKEPPRGWREMVEHFQSEYHTGSGADPDADEPDMGGVYFKYLEDVPPLFASYDDVFLIETDDMTFGIALCVEEDLDTGGIYILKPKQIARFASEFVYAWKEGYDTLRLRVVSDSLLYIFV